MPAISTRNARVSITPLDANGVAIVGGVVYNVLATNCTIDVMAAEIDVTTFESVGFEQYLPSYVGAHISVDGFYDFPNRPFLNAVGVQGIVAAARLAMTISPNRAPAIGGGAAEVWFFPDSFVMTVHHGMAVKDAGRVSFTARNNGAFSYPTGLTFAGVL